MRRLEIAEAMRAAIRQEIARSEESRYDHRLHGLLLIAAGQSTQQVADLFDVNRRTVQRWLNAFVKHGFAGLAENVGRRGRPRALSPGQMTALRRDLRRRPWEFGYLGGSWDGRLLSEHLLRKYRVKLGMRQCQRVFRQLAIPLRKHGGPVEVKAFKSASSNRTGRC